MRIADFGQLSPAFDVDNSIVTATQGSIDLDPYRATQFDISVEHYFGEGNMVSFAVFYKDVESFLNNESTCIAAPSTSGTNVTEWQSVCQLNTAGVNNTDMVFSNSTQFTDAEGLAYISGLRDAGLTGIDTKKDTNGENGKVQGFEIGYQQFFTSLPDAWSGLGVSANYTYADSEQPNGNPLLDISKNTYNLQVFWEYEGVSTRLAYNYRDDRGQLDFSASWDINEHFTVVANATNLTGEPSIFKSELGSSWMYTEADRRYTVGVRAKF